MVEVVDVELRKMVTHIIIIMNAAVIDFICLMFHIIDFMYTVVFTG